MDARGSTVEWISLTPQRRAQVVRCAPPCDAAQVVAALGLPRPAPVVVVNGTTAPLPPAVAAPVSAAFTDAVVPVARDHGAVVVTGGTDAGVIALLGQAVDGADAPPCVGVAPWGTTTWPGRSQPPASPDAAPLEPHHRHFVLVEGTRWGSETATMLALVAALSADAGSVAVLVGGGEVAETELAGHRAAGRGIVVVRGSGRLADRVAAERSTNGAGPPPGTAVWDAGDPPAQLRAVLASHLGTS